MESFLDEYKRRRAFELGGNPEVELQLFSKVTFLFQMCQSGESDNKGFRKTLSGERH